MGAQTTGEDLAILVLQTQQLKQLYTTNRRLTTESLAILVLQTQQLKLLNRFQNNCISRTCNLSSSNPATETNLCHRDVVSLRVALGCDAHIGAKSVDFFSQRLQSLQASAFCRLSNLQHKKRAPVFGRSLTFNCWTKPSFQTGYLFCDAPNIHGRVRLIAY